MIGYKLLRTGQTTSYRTDDDGDLEKGRDVSFTVLSNNNPFGNTNRFTDELGTQVYAKNIAIDWSTYDNSTVLGWDIRINGTGLSVNQTWNQSIDNAATHSVTGFTSGWYLPNRQEFSSILNDGVATNQLNYSPFNLALVVGLWCSTTDSTTTTKALWFYPATRAVTSSAKTTALRFFPCRNFTVTGTTLT